MASSENIYSINEVRAAGASDEDLTQADNYEQENYNLGSMNKLLTQTGQRSKDDIRRLDQLKNEFHNHQKEMAKWQQSVDDKLQLILDKLGCRMEPQDSQSLLSGGHPVFATPLVPFVIIKHPDGRSEDVHFSKAAVADIMASTKDREMIRKVLLHVHDNDIQLLRLFTLTGKTKTGRKRNSETIPETDSEAFVDGDEEENVKQQLPYRTVLIAQETIKKLNPVNPRLLEVDHKLASKQEQEVRSHITAVLNYFYTNYDANGKVQVPKKTSKKLKF